MTPLDIEIRRMIATDGPMTVAQYMTLCLSHPTLGYYATRDPLGAQGDFVTAPEISQMFGELLGLWAAAVWELMGSPDAVHLVELGPGRGTLMADSLRATRNLASFGSAVKVSLVETSPVLRDRQRAALEGFGQPLGWHDAVEELPPGPVIAIANEFLDALPVHQAVKAATGWHERMVGLGPEGDLVFALSPDPIPGLAAKLSPPLRADPEGAILEWRDDITATELGRRVARFGGAALFIDYGHVASAFGDTLQAVRRHDFVSPLADAGETDLTAHVDFAALGVAAARAGARVYGPVPQGMFLRRLGLMERAERLRAHATEGQASDIDAACLRLTEPGPTGMGELFKAMAIADPRLDVLPGFEG